MPSSHIPPRSRGILETQAEISYVSRVIRLPVQQYIHTESIGGLALLVATIVALLLANSPWVHDYHLVLESHLALDLHIFSSLDYHVGGHDLFRNIDRFLLDIDFTLQEWVDEGLMAIFFFVVGLEIKRELLFGHLSSPRSAEWSCRPASIC